MKKVLFISPHPDDETLGCGGTILFHKSKKHRIYWLNFTSMYQDDVWSPKEIRIRNNEIKQIINFYKFDKYINLGFPTTTLDQVSINEMAKILIKNLNHLKPNIIYYPFKNDIHTDHQIVHQVVNSSTKWFRFPYLEKILMYETLSETDFNFTNDNFRPNVFIDISRFLEKKITAMKKYKTEIGKHPFPRNVDSIKSLAVVRGVQSGFKYAEGFELVNELVKQ